MKQIFTIPGKLPGYNQLTQGHWTDQRGAKREAMDLVGWMTKMAHIKPVEGKATISIVCYEPNKKRDKSNVRAGAEKIILDSLQEIGIIKNDNWTWLNDCPAVVELDRYNPRVVVEIEDTI